MLPGSFCSFDSNHTKALSVNVPVAERMRDSCTHIQLIKINQEIRRLFVSLAVIDIALAVLAVGLF